MKRPRITDLNRGFVPMHTFPHLDGDPIKEFQRERGVVLEVSPVLCVPVAVEDPNGDDRILDTLVGLGFQVLGGMHICVERRGSICKLLSQGRRNVLKFLHEVMETSLPCGHHG